MSSGYSGTPLIKKLGIKEGYQIKVINEPDNYFELLGKLPANIQIVKEDDKKTYLNFIHIFVKNMKEFSDLIKKVKSEIKSNGTIWISWPKKASKIQTDISENLIREVILTMGLVDVKICAVDEIWSGLKVVYRKENIIKTTSY